MSDLKPFAPEQRHLERDQLDLFCAAPGDRAPHDAQDLMAYLFFSLAKSKRIVAIDFRPRTITIGEEAVPEHGMATIWDADIFIRAASQIVEARDAGLKTPRLAATPYEILTFADPGTNVRNYDRHDVALDRLQSSTIVTSIRQPTERRRHRLSWINEGRETPAMLGLAFGIEMILLDLFDTGVLNEALVLTIDRAYCDLTGGFERRFYRLLRKNGGRQAGHWSFDLVHLHVNSGSRPPLKHFAYDLRQIVRRQTLRGYRRVITRDASGAERLGFAPIRRNPIPERSRGRGRTSRSGENLLRSRTRSLVPSGTGRSCYWGRRLPLTLCSAAASRSRNSANCESLFLRTNLGLSSAISEATAAKVPQQSHTGRRPDGSAAVNVVAANRARKSTCWHGQQTSPNKGASDE